MPWVVQLAGDEADLAALAESLTAGHVAISRRDEGYVLTSDRFALIQDARAVHEEAEDIVAMIIGASRLELGSQSVAVRVGDVYRQREDGGRDFFLLCETLTFRLRGGSATMRVVRQDGSVEESHTADPVEQWVETAVSDNRVADALRILSGPFDWVNLYRVLEIVAADARGLASIVSNGWASESSLRLFKHTANSPGAIGIASRHGATNSQPPPNPMDISEARKLISSIAQAWLREKVRNGQRKEARSETDSGSA